MATNERLERLGDNPFARLNGLLADVVPTASLTPLILSVGEPQHAPPAFLAETIARNAGSWNRYPPVEGTAELRGAIAGWLGRRYGLPPGFVDPDRHLLALAGSKEGLYLAVQMAVPQEKAGRVPTVLVPNPFYQAYIGAAGMTGAEIVPLEATRATGFLPDFRAVPEAILERCSLAFLCSPANPQGAIADLETLGHAISLARRHDFVLAVDECYSEIYGAAAPPGALQAALALGGGLDNLLVFNSLSKRSNAAGLRVGFVAGDERLIRRFRMLRNYAAAQIPLPLQAGAAARWRDEAHVEANRALYRAKFDLAERILGGRYGFYRPQGGFFLWLDVGDGAAAARRLWQEAAVKALPGEYLCRSDARGRNPGIPYLRIALVHDEATIADALGRLQRVL